MKRQLTQKLVAISLVVILTSCKSYILYSDKEIDNNNSKEIIVSRFKGGVVTLEDAKTELGKIIIKDSKLQGITFEALNNEQKEVVIKEVIINKIAVKEAKKRHLDNADDYKKAVDIFTTELLKQKLITNISDNVTENTDLQKKYDELAGELAQKQDVKIRYIAVKEEAEAKNLYKILKKSPRSFSSYARKKSIDKETAKNGGSLGGFILRDSLPEQVVIYTKKMKKYEISEPIKVGDRWLLVKFEGERPAKIETFENSKESLAKQIAQKEVNDFVSNSIKKAEIKFFLD